MSEKIPIEDLKSELKRLNEDVEGVPSTIDMNEKGNYKAATYYKNFENWSVALDESGIDNNKRSNNKIMN